MFVVVQIGSTQYSIKEKDEILVDRLEIEEGKNYKIEKVLLLSEDDGKKVMIGMPYLETVKVEARVLGHEKGEKIRVFKMKPKKRYTRTRGHRSEYTRLKILKVSMLNSSSKAKDAPEMAEESTPVKKKETKSTTTKRATKKKEE